MKNRLFLLTLTSMLFFAACSPVTSDVVDSTEEIVVEASAIDVEETTPEEEEIQQELSSIDNDAVEVSFSQDVWPILEEYALAAHGGKGGVFLESYKDIMEYIESGNPESSLLYRALIGDGMKQMPPGNPLPDELIQTIYNWIEQGAKEN